MSTEAQLERIETKLDRVSDELATIKANQARDLQRFEGIDRQFVDAAKDASRDLALHGATCEAKKEIKAVNDRLDAFANQAKGAGWAGRKIWAAIVGISLLALDICLRLFKH